MPGYNGNGTFSRVHNWENDRDAGIKILASRFDAECDGFATGLSTAICKDGQTAVTADITLSSHKLIGLADGTALTHAASVSQVQKNVVAFCAAGGTADAITGAFTPTITSLTNGMIVRVAASAANATTTPTFRAESLDSARTITKLGGQALSIGDIFGAGHIMELQWVSASTRWELLNPAASIAGRLSLPGDISPSAIAAQADDYNPTGLSTASVIRITLTGNQSIGGVAGGADGRILIIVNVDTTDTATILNDDGDSTAANRFLFWGGIDEFIEPNGSRLFWYDGTSSRWRLVGWRFRKPAFHAHKNGSDQGSIADNGNTAVTFGTKLFDLGGFFASNGWTPPAGPVHLHACLNFTQANLEIGDTLIARIFKDGSPFKSGPVVRVSVSTTAHGCEVSCDDIANGSNVYTVSAFFSDVSGSASATIEGDATDTYFCGFMI